MKARARSLLLAAIALPVPWAVVLCSKLLPKPAPARGQRIEAVLRRLDGSEFVIVSEFDGERWRELERRPRNGAAA